MEEALELVNYLPLSFKTRSEEEYIAFLWDAFNTNYNSSKYEFASLAFHLMYMSFVSFSIWEIRLVRDKEFHHALIGFQSETEKDLLAADTPFKFYDRLKESQIFRFMKIVGCGNEQVGEFSKFVKRRNKIAHPSGTVFFNDQQAIDDEIDEMMKEVINIQMHMRPIILDLYDKFLRESADPEEREYSTPKEQIEAKLIHQNYFSQKDIDICLSFDLTNLADHPQYNNMLDLHDALKAEYGAEFANGPL
jgi:hypothetical protein